MRLRILRIAVVTALLAALAPAGLVPPARAGKAAEVRTSSFELLNEGVAAYRRGDFAVAVDRLTLSAGMALNSFRAYYYLGLALIGDRRYSDALEALEIALDLDPNHFQAIVATGDELTPIGEPLGPASIPDSNSESIAAQVIAAGAERVAVCAAVTESSDPGEACRRLKEKLINLIDETPSVPK